MSSSAPELSVVVPMFNESESIAEFCTQTRAVLDELGVTYEIVFVDDGSRDDTVQLVKDQDWQQARVVRLVSNAGHMAALDAGYRASTGEYVITMDSDLQHPPSLIPELLLTARTEQVDVVYAARRRREGDSWFKRTTAVAYYRSMRTLTGVDVEESAADFRLVSRRVVSVIRGLPAGHQVFRLLIPSLGFPSRTIFYEANERFAGASKYTVRHMVNLSAESVIAFTTKPLTISIRVGLVVSLIAVLGFVYVLITYLTGQALEGWASVISTVLLLFGMLFVLLGVFGMYIGAIVRTLMARPRYLVRDEWAPLTRTEGE